VSRERIAVVTTSYPEHAGDPSGHFVQAEVRALESEGHEVVVFALRGSAFGWPGVTAKLKKNPLRIFGAAKEVARVTSAVSQNGLFSRVIAHWAIPCAWPIARKCKRVEIVSHGSDVRLLVALPKPVRHLLVEQMLQNACSWRFPSDSLKNALLASLGTELRARVASMSTVVAPALEAIVNQETVQTVRGIQQRVARGQPVFVVAARLIPSKRVERAIEYAAQQNAWLFIIGDGPDEERLRRVARKSTATVAFLGRLTRPKTLVQIAAADALLHASVAEGLSSVVREAELLGTTVIRLEP
jgi:teichuronic acid biosynthesis glycosyltransferase TuaC